VKNNSILIKKNQTRQDKWTELYDDMSKVENLPQELGGIRKTLAISSNNFL